MTHKKHINEIPAGNDSDSYVISNYLLSTFEDIILLNAWGENSFFYNPSNASPRGTYFCTIKEKDGDNDKASELYRSNIFRFNFGVSKKTFADLFGNIPKRPAKGSVIDYDCDFSQVDILQPHPIYGWMCWVAILNPTKETFDELKILLEESYRLVLMKHQKKLV